MNLRKRAKIFIFFKTGNPIFPKKFQNCVIGSLKAQEIPEKFWLIRHGDLDPEKQVCGKNSLGWR